MTVRTLRSANRNLNQIPIPHRSIPEARGQDLDFINVAHSHLIHSDWGKLAGLSPHLTPFRVKHVQLKIQRDFVLSLEFFNWVKLHNPAAHTLETHSIILHVLTKNRKFKSAESITKDVLRNGSVVIAGYCRKGLLSSAMKLKSSMEKTNNNGNVVTFNTLIHGFCKEGRLQEARKLLSEMKIGNVAPNIVTFNTLMNARGNSCEMNDVLYQEMMNAGIKPDILTYNALIAGLCRDGKTKKAAYLVKELVEKEKIDPTASTFAALISGQCVRNDPDRGWQLYKAMARSGFGPNKETFNVLVDAFYKKKDFEGAVQVLLEMFDKCATPASSFVADTYDGLRRCGMDRLAAKLRSAVDARNLAVVHLETSPGSTTTKAS
ncbi:Pentatricopeptide repeat-containing protein At4g26680, mitochondrial [Linum grandiflorum]